MKQRVLFIGLALVLTLCTFGFLQAAVASAQRGPAATIIVDTIDPAVNTGDGMCSLIEAINNANADADTSNGDCLPGSGPDTVTLAASATYTLTAVDNSTAGANGLPVITSTVTISGQGSTIARSTAESTPSFRILFVGSNGDLTLDHLTVRNGYSAGQHGGGIFNQGGSLTLNNSHVSDNTVEDAEGGGIYNDSGAVSLFNSIVSYNSTVEISTAQDSGAIANKALTGDATVTVVSSQLISNTAAGGGGAIANRAFSNLTATVMISDSLVSYNAAGASAGAFANFQQSGEFGANSRIFISHSEVSHNVANNSPGFVGAGAILNISNISNNNTSVLIIEDSAISYNMTDNGITLGGAILNDEAVVTITRSILNGNVAHSPGGGGGPRGGGAIGNTDGTVTIVNSTLSGNAITGATSAGGAIHNFNFWGAAPSIIRLINSTVSENTASGDGGAVYNVSRPMPSEVEFVNSIIAGNNAADGKNCTGTRLHLSGVQPGRPRYLQLRSVGRPGKYRAPAWSVAE